MKLLDGALEYCNDIVSGKEVTTVEVVQQCNFFLDDYNIRQHDEKFEFYADEKELKKINNLLRLFNFATGFVAGKEVLENLSPYQCFLISGVFLFRYKGNKLKFKNNDITLFISRKNAKTATIALIFLILMLTEQEYSEFYSICLTKELAAEIKKIMGQIIGASPLVNKHFIVSTTKCGQIKCSLTSSYFEPRVAEPGKNNSIRPSAFVSDEHGNFKDVSNFTAMKGGQKNVINPLIFRTTTAYAINDSIMEQDLIYIRAVLDGTITQDKRLFALIYYAEKEHLWDDTGLLQANPLRIEENYSIMRAEREKARIQTNLQEEYLTKTCNNFVEENAMNKYLEIDYWKKCEVDVVDFSGEEVIVSIDLSVTTDLTAVGIECKKEDGFIYCHSHGFLPEESLATRRENIDYRAYERLGYCDIHKGMTVDYEKVEEYVRNIEAKHNCKIKTIVTDPANAKEMMGRLGNDYEVILLKQTYTNLSPSTKEFRKKVYDGFVRHEKNELLDWNMRNATTSKGKADDEMLNKEDKNKQRIDMVVVLVFGYTELMDTGTSYDAAAALDSMDW